MSELRARASRRWRRLGLALLVTALTVVGVAHLEVTTKQGVNFEVTTHRMPLYVKALQFINRSVQYEQIADEVTEGAVSDADRALKVFDWTRRQIKPTPKDWTILDDHILHIIIRGHGVNDQQADVFATLATYSGVPAFWTKVRLQPEGPGVILSFALVDGRWRVFDVFAGIAFRDDTGKLATMDGLRGRPDLVPASMRTVLVEGLAYEDIVTRASMPAIPETLRAELQMPTARLWYQVKVALRLESPH